jgi:hypothetical protein
VSKLFESDQAPALDVLSSGLTAEQPWQRRETVRAIDRLGALVRATLPGLTRLRDDPDPRIRQTIESAIARVEAK